MTSQSSLPGTPGVAQRSPPGPPAPTSWGGCSSTPRPGTTWRSPTPRSSASRTTTSPDRPPPDPHRPPLLPPCHSSRRPSITPLPPIGPSPSEHGAGDASRTEPRIPCVAPSRRSPLSHCHATGISQAREVPGPRSHKPRKGIHPATSAEVSFRSVQGMNGMVLETEGVSVVTLCHPGPLHPQPSTGPSFSPPQGHGVIDEFLPESPPPPYASQRRPPLLRDP